jgi:hypothetical protein
MHSKCNYQNKNFENEHELLGFVYHTNVCSSQNKNNKYSQYNTINTNVLIIDHVNIVSRMGDMVYSSCSPSDGAVYLPP